MYRLNVDDSINTRQMCNTTKNPYSASYVFFCLTSLLFTFYMCIVFIRRNSPILTDARQHIMYTHTHILNSTQNRFWNDHRCRKSKSEWVLNHPWIFFPQCCTLRTLYILQTSDFYIDSLVVEYIIFFVCIWLYRKVEKRVCKRLTSFIRRVDYRAKQIISNMMVDGFIAFSTVHAAYCKN